MRVEVLDVARREPGLPKRRRHGTGRAFAVFRSRSDVVGIRRGSVADQFGHGLCTPRPRMLQRFDHEDTRTFAHHEAVAVPVEGAGCALGRLVEAGRRARAAAKPPRLTRSMQASVPPHTARSASPERIRRAASPIAWTLAAQAVTGAPRGPLKP